MNRLEQKGIIVGMLLGDASLNLPNKKGRNGTSHGKSKNWRLSITHCEEQRDYLKWKGDLLGKITSIRYDDFIGGYKKNRNYRLTTRCHPIYTKIAERMYIDGRKTFDNHILSTLNTKGLAIWYMDDGYLRVDKKVSELSTCSFTYPEHYLLRKMMWDKFGLSTTIHRKGKYYRLYIRRTSMDLFLKLVYPHITEVKSMLYKVRTKEPEKARYSLNPLVTMGNK